MAAGRVNYQQAVGNGRRTAPHHPVPGNMWIEGLSTADRPQKKEEEGVSKVCNTESTQQNWTALLSASTSLALDQGSTGEDFCEMGRCISGPF